MKRIKIFLASSIDELRLDRLEVGDFFDRLNGIYHERGIDLRLIKCENYDNSIAINGKQSEYDDEIRDSELVFFLFFKKVGDITKHEFEVAVESFKEKKKPHIFTYFKYINSLEEVTDEVKTFMKRLASEMNHYYNSYKDIDTLKLGILMQIQMLMPTSGDIKIDDGKVVIAGEEFISTDKIPAFSGNENLQKIKEDLKAVNDKFLSLQKKFIENPNDKNTYLSFLEIANKKADLEKSLNDIEENTFKLLKSMIKKQSEGDLSYRQAEGYRLLEMGDYDGALAVLNLDDIYSDIEKNEKVSEYAKGALLQNIDELLSRIDALEAKGVTPEIIDEIDAIYKKACDLCEKNNLEKDVFHLYVDFLYCQTRFSDAKKILQKLEHYYAISESDEDKVKLYNQFGMIYYALKNPKAKKYYEDAIEITKSLKKGNIKVNEHDMAASHNNLANIYTDTKDFENAEMHLLEAVRICKRLTDKNPEKYESDLALSYNNLGNVYDDWKKEADAESFYLKAIKIQKKLVRKNAEKYELDLALSYNNLACLYGKQLGAKDSFKNAFNYYLKALKIYERAVCKNPERVEFVLASLYNNLGDFCLYSKTGDAKNYFLMALKILERLTLKSPGVFEADLAQCYNNIAIMHTGSEADAYFSKAVEIYEALVEKNPEIIGEKLLNLYFEMGLFKYNSKNFEDAKLYFKKVIHVHKKFSLKNNDIPEIVESFLGGID